MHGRRVVITTDSYPDIYCGPEVQLFTSVQQWVQHAKRVWDRHWPQRFLPLMAIITDVFSYILKNKTR